MAPARAVRDGSLQSREPRLPVAHRESRSNAPPARGRSPSRAQRGSKATSVPSPQPRPRRGLGPPRSTATATTWLGVVLAGSAIMAASASTPLGRPGRHAGWRRVLGAVVGLLRYLLPLVLVAGGVLLIRGPAQRRRRAERRSRRRDAMRRAPSCPRRASCLAVPSAGCSTSRSTRRPSTAAGSTRSRRRRPRRRGRGGPLDSLSWCGARRRPRAGRALARCVGSLRVVPVASVELGGPASPPPAAAIGEWLGDLFRVDASRRGRRGRRSSPTDPADDLGDATQLFDQDVPARACRASRRKSEAGRADAGAPARSGRTDHPARDRPRPGRRRVRVPAAAAQPRCRCRASRRSTPTR